jgi:protein farnesyltransferase/geranylgeranyltransferase type-1 subunit alpha
MGYFRAILEKGEVSQRAFNLTSEIIMENQGNYTAWWWRRKCLYELKMDLKEEMASINKECIIMEKVYQFWQHKRVIAEALLKQSNLDIPAEIATLQQLYKSDPKNFHMWTYRMWLTEALSLWKDEVAFMETEISANPTNNSLWNYRYFLHTKTLQITVEFVNNEIEYNVYQILQRND